MKQVDESKIFPTSVKAIYWAMKKYPDATKYTMTLVPIIGEGVKAIIYERDAAPEVSKPAKPKTKSKKK